MTWTSLAWRRAAALGAGAAWLHQGLWCKALDGDPAHRAVLAAVPGIGAGRARAAATALGLAETGLAVLVATRGDRRWVAGLQTALIAAFNAGGLTLGRRHIPHAGRLVARNGALLALIWAPVDGAG